jgi:prepilin peptidase CpaA
MFVQLLVIMAIAGGVLTVVMFFWHTARKQKDKLAIPYGVAIAFGGLWVLAANYLPDGATSALTA